MIVFSGKYRKIELFIKAQEKGESLLRLYEGECEIFRFYPKTSDYQRVAIPLKTEEEYRICIEHATVSQMYLCGNDDILETGIKYLMINGENMEMFHVDGVMDTPIREQYHFTPFVNWSNDPNGLCWYKGYYHLFYQSNPHEQKWGRMYWGHAASRDLIHWKHLPFALDPQKEVLESELLTGGAFSGSAISMEDGIRLFFTRDVEQIGDSGSIRQSQATAWSRDGVSFGEEQEILPALSLQGTDVNFRDPKVFLLDGKWYMALAANYCGKAAALLYSSGDLRQWTFTGPLLQLEDPDIPSLECPDFFPLGDDYVLLVSVMDVKVQYGAKQPVNYYVGEWKGEKFRASCEGVCDFGENFYAAQTFEHAGRRILFGWICDWQKEHEIEKHGAYGSMTIPRVLSTKEHRLYQTPASEVYNLLGEILVEKEQCARVELEIPGNSYYSSISFSEETSFEILLAEDGEDFLKLVGCDGVLELISTRTGNRPVKFVAKTKRIRKIEIFMDRRVVEIYVNDGEAVGTKLFVNHSKRGIFEASFADALNVTQVLVRQMEAIWKNMLCAQKD